VVKFGIDGRDSMLTRENFRDTWARPRADKRKANSRPEDMVIDQNNTEIKEDTPGMELEIEGAKETPSEDVVTDATVDMNGKENKRPWQKRKMPIFTFQRNGIGVVNANWQHQKPRRK
jgi:hypothetical protein